MTTSRTGVKFGRFGKGDGFGFTGGRCAREGFRDVFSNRQQGWLLRHRVVW